MDTNQDIVDLVNHLNEQQNRLAENLHSGHLQMRNLAKRVWRVQEDERKHIAQELHDGVGQLLMALINQLQQLNEQIPEDEFAEVMNLAQQALADTREISRLMRPRILDDLGLVPALQWLIRVMCDKTNVDAQLQQQVSSDLDGETATLAFRVIQEAMTNAIKHAECTKIHIQLIVTDKLFMVKISDNGKGFVADRLNKEHGFGLSAMEDRVAAFGGQLQVSSELGKGCEIKVLIAGNRS
jgi:two-component system, NarL family, sensor kinase